MNLNLRNLERRFDLETYLEELEPKKVGDQFIVACPHCDREDKLYILAEDKVNAEGRPVARGAWTCYYCAADPDNGASGYTCLSLIEWLEDCEWLEAVRRLQEGGTASEGDFADAITKALNALASEDEEDEDDAPAPTIALPREFIGIDEKHYPAYAKERGFSVERCMRFKLGYALKGNFANRLIAPTYFERRCVGFQARWMAKKPPIDPETGKRISKTKHSFGAKMSRVLYNWDVARRAKRLVIVESPWAAIKLGSSAAATFGNKMSASQLELIMKGDANEVIIIWDMDEEAKPGQSGYERALAVGERLSTVVPVRVPKLTRDIDRMKVNDVKELIERTPVLSSSNAFAERLHRRLSML